MNVVIPMAGQGRRLKSYGPKGLIKLAGETVSRRQLRLIKSVYPEAHFVVVAGFEADRVRRHLPTTTIVVNSEFEATNVAHSIALGLQACPPGDVLVVYGDLVFSANALDGLDAEQSSVIIQPTDKKHARWSEVGVTVVNGVVTCFSYGLPDKWAQIILLKDPERALFEQVAAEPHRRRQFSYEVLNEVINRGGVFAASYPPNLELVEIDFSKDIGPACKIG